MHAISINLSQENRRKKKEKKKRKKKKRKKGKKQQPVTGGIRCVPKQLQPVTDFGTRFGPRGKTPSGDNTSVSEVVAFFTIVSVPFFGFLVRDVLLHSNEVLCCCWRDNS